MHGLGRFFAHHRQRLARLLAVAGVLVVALLLGPKVPQPLEVELELPKTHRELVEVRVSYVQAGEELVGARLAFPDGAPSTVRHTAKVPSGDVEVHAQALRADGRAVSAIAYAKSPTDGTLVIRLAEELR
jgi:hypothetical protein